MLTGWSIHQAMESCMSGCKWILINSEPEGYKLHMGGRCDLALQGVNPSVILKLLLDRSIFPSN